MTEVELHRRSDGLHTSLGFAYPYAIDVPLSSYLLHQDAKSHLSVEFDRQTRSLVGSNTEMAALMADGLQQARAELRSFSEDMSDQLSETNDWLSTIDQSLDRVCNHLEVIETGIDRLTLAVRRGTGEVVGALGQISSQLSELNQTASQIARMLKDSELTWALEQARDAARAMRVGDLATAETAATRALYGGGGHVGAPTQVGFMLQLVEILIRQGSYRLKDSGAALNRARQYLALDPSPETQARYDFACGSHSLLCASILWEKGELVDAAASFESAMAVKRYMTVATIWKAVAETRLGLPREQIVEPLARLLHSKPFCVMEVLRLRGNGLDPDTADAAVQQATACLYEDTADLSKYVQIRQKTASALQQIGALSHTRTEFGSKAQALTELLTAMEVFIDRAMEMRRKNDLTSAYGIVKQRRMADNKIDRIQAKLKAM